MRKNNEGFVITEVLILSTVVVGILIFMYIQFKNINRSYQYSFNYDTVEGLYLANNIVNYINSGFYDNLVGMLNEDNSAYLDITDCETFDFDADYCDILFNASLVDQIIFTKENLADLRRNMGELSDDFKSYIKSIQVANSLNDYRVLIRYRNKTFATMRFNNGEKYVQSGLVVYLDGINNTSSGHSDTSNEWIDLSGNGNNAILYRNPVWSNNSLTFNGIDSYARIENTAGFDFNNGTTWEARVRVLSLDGINTINSSVEFLGNWENGGGGLLYSDDNKFYSNFSMNTDLKTLVNDVQSDISSYYTVTVTYDNLVQKLYINGQLVSTDGVLESSNINSSLAPITLGGNPKVNYNVMDSFANVEFQSVRIYNRALKEYEVLKNYQIDETRF